MRLTSDNEVHGDRVGAVEVLHGEGVGSAVHLAHAHQGQPGQVAVGQLQVGTHIRTQIRLGLSSLPPPPPSPSRIVLYRSGEASYRGKERANTVY